MLIHHHLLFQASVGKNYDGDAESTLTQFLLDLVTAIDMEVLIEPRVTFSKFRAWTGLIGIITSHIAFHYWVDEGYIQLDIYSCKEFDKEKAVEFISSFWDATDVYTLFIDREVGKAFSVSDNASSL